MSKWKTRPGVTLTEIHGVFLLAADREAREHCSYIRQINELGALIWECLAEEKDRDEMICSMQSAALFMRIMDLLILHPPVSVCCGYVFL